MGQATAPLSGLNGKSHGHDYTFWLEKDKTKQFHTFSFSLPPNCSLECPSARLLSFTHQKQGDHTEAGSHWHDI